MHVKASHFTSHLAVYSKAYQCKQQRNHQSSPLPMVDDGFPAVLQNSNVPLCKMESAHIVISWWQIFSIWNGYMIELDPIIIMSVITCHYTKHGNYAGRTYSIFLNNSHHFVVLCFVLVISSVPEASWISNCIHYKVWDEITYPSGFIATGVIKIPWHFPDISLTVFIFPWQNVTIKV